MYHQASKKNTEKHSHLCAGVRESCQGLERLYTLVSAGVCPSRSPRRAALSGTCCLSALSHTHLNKIKVTLNSSQSCSTVVRPAAARREELQWKLGHVRPMHSILPTLETLSSQNNIVYTSLFQVRTKSESTSILILSLPFYSVLYYYFLFDPRTEDG